MKTCSKCKVEKPNGDFAKNKSRSDGLQYWCKICHRSKQKKQNKVSVEEKYCRRCGTTKTRDHFTRDKNRSDGLSDYCRPCRSLMKAASKYKISEMEVKNLVSRGCEICGTVESICIDHCHDTGLVRGALCQKCNKAIGLLNDDPSLICLAFDYLKRFK